MPRTLRIQFSGAFYHVMAPGWWQTGFREGQRLGKEHKGKMKRALSLVKENTIRQTKLSILAVMLVDSKIILFSFDFRT